MGRYYDESQVPTSIGEEILNASRILGQLMLTKSAEKRKSKADIDTSTKKALIGAILGGKGKFKEGSGFNIQDMMAGGQMPDLSQYETIPDQPTVSITQTPYSFTDKLKARNILGRSAKDVYKDADTKGFAERKGGFFGLGSTYEYTPEYEQMRGEAQTIVSGKGRTTKRISGKGKAAPVFSGRAAVADVDAMKPANVPQAEWDAATKEQKIELLTGMGIL